MAKLWWMMSLSLPNQPVTIYPTKGRLAFDSVLQILHFGGVTESDWVHIRILSGFDPTRHCCERYATQTLESY